MRGDDKTKENCDDFSDSSHGNDGVLKGHLSLKRSRGARLGRFTKQRVLEGSNRFALISPPSPHHSYYPLPSTTTKQGAFSIT